MTEKQARLLEFLKYFDRLCRESDIQYFLAGGSMLGAVRHGGFLPWDDDADLYIKETELRKALPILEEKLDARYSIEALESKRECANTIVRIVDTETCEYHRSRLADNTAHGIYLEFFRLDPVPEALINDDSYYKDFWVYCEGLSKYNVVATPTLDLSKLDVNEYLSFQKKLDNGDREKILMERENELFSFKEEDCERYHERWGHYWLLYPKEAFASQLYVPFEDTELPVPVGFADICYGEYGDNWMEIPDVDDQATHPGVENYHVSYKQYDEDIYTRLDKQRFLDMTLEKKVNRVKATFFQYGIRLERLKAQGRLLKMQFDNVDTISKCRELTAGHDYSGVLNTIGKYTDAQRAAYGDNFCFDMHNDIKYYAAYAKLMTGDLRYVERLKQNLRHNSDERLFSLFADLPEIRRLRYSYFYGRLNENRDRLAAMLAKYPDQLNLRELNITLNVNDGDNARDIAKELDELTKLYPRRYRLMKLKGDLAVREGDIAGAKKIFKDILTVSNDGMVNNEIRDIMKKL